MNPQESNPDQRGTLFKGPAGWFTLEVPPELDIEQNEAIVEFKARSQNHTDAGKWSLTLYSAWVEDRKSNNQADAFDPSTLFPVVLRIIQERPLSVDGKSRSLSGTSVQPTKDPWWRGLFRLRPFYHWRLWVIEYKSILIVASLQAHRRTVLTEETVTCCETLLNSIEFSSQLAVPPELFRREVLKLAKSHFPLLTFKATGSFSIKVAESDVNLANFYRSYLLNPSSIKQIILPGITAMVRIQEWGPDQLLPPLDEIRDRVMPMLYPQNSPSEEMRDFVQIPWVGGLNLMFVEDDQDTYRFIHKEMLERWSLNEDELLQIALRNLENFAADHPLELTVVKEESETQILMPVNADAYNSVRILNAGLQGQLRELLGQELVVGIPNRDFFVAVPTKDRTLVQQIKERVDEDFRSMHHPLTNRLLVISADGVSEYCED